MLCKNCNQEVASVAIMVSDKDTKKKMKVCGQCANVIRKDIKHHKKG